MKKVLFIMAILSAALIGCGKDKKNGGQAAAVCNPNFNQFGHSGNGRYYSPQINVCIDRQTNRAVSYNLCTQSGAAFGNNGFNGFNNVGCNQFGNGFNQFGNNGFGFDQFNNVSSPQCSFLQRPGFYYIYQVYPGTRTEVCVEFSTVPNYSYYNYQTPAYYPYPVGGNAGLYGYFRLGF